MFSINSVQFFLIKIANVQKSMSLNIVMLGRITYKHQRTPTGLCEHCGLPLQVFTLPNYMLAGFHKTVHVCGCYDMAADGISSTVAITGLYFSFFIVMTTHFKRQLTLT